MADFNPQGNGSESLSSSTTGDSSTGASIGNPFSGETISRLIENFGDLPVRGQEVFGRIDRHARANPWLHIGLVGAGALALGYLVGRTTSQPSRSVGFSREADEFEQAYDE